MIENMVEMEPGRAFRVKPSGDRWEIEYLRRHVLPESQTEWRVEVVKPCYDRAVWVLWDRLMWELGSGPESMPTGDSFVEKFHTPDLLS
jgi:hypothetical protein